MFRLRNLAVFSSEPVRPVMHAKTTKRVRRASFSAYLPRLVVKPDQSMVSRQHLAVERCVVLGRAAASNRAPDLDWLVQVDMAFLKWV